MSLFKCKMCGGALEISDRETVATCEYCGTTQTLPKLDDEKRANMYDRANHFRRNNDFDKAMGIYESILNEDSTDAEAYWSLVLCRYGIEYVEDPLSHKRLPTVNRAQFTSIFDDEDYKSAIANADIRQRAIYESEATEINEIQKGILAISQKEEPFDVFICYKETDNNGRRTPDSVLAQELYYGLKDEGFKVFFSRITLEDKLGSAYEPYIFAALNSAKVMVVLGTRQEHFNAVWVKNEWSRFLSLIKSGSKKVIIPAYKDMNPYDLPEEFSHLQAQDMSKLGFMQDLIRGIKKLVTPEEPKIVIKDAILREPTPAPTINISPLLKRAFIFLEDGEFDRADEFCEQVLNQDPECAEAYLVKLMVELRVKNQEDLKDQTKPFDTNNNYLKAIRFANDDFKSTLNIYAQTCREKAETARKDNILANGKAQMNGVIVSNYESAIKHFELIPGWKDADALIAKCKKAIEQIKVKEEADRIEREKQAEQKKKRTKKTAIILSSVALIAVILVFTVIVPFIAVMNGDYYVYINMYNVKEFDIPDGATTIDKDAFKDCTSLTSITIPNSVNYIEIGAFKDCENLKSATICDGTTSIGRYTFYNCPNLTSITIPDSVTEIGQGAFYGCVGLKSIKFKGTMAQWKAISKGGFWDALTDNYTIYCTDGTISKL